MHSLEKRGFLYLSKDMQIRAESGLVRNTELGTIQHDDIA